MSSNIILEGWLTKSPPSKRIWRAKWRKRWFLLRKNWDLPGQYLLEYYTDRSCRKLKGSINLDFCEQVDAGLHMERGNSSVDTKVRGSVFSLKTNTRTYYLEAECEAEMEEWVEKICRVCGLRASESGPNSKATYQNIMKKSRTEITSEAGLYIPISECTTGERIQDNRRFTFDTNVSTSKRYHGDSRKTHVYTTVPQRRVKVFEVAESDDSVSEDERRSIRNQHYDINVPPPRPPKPFQGPKMREPSEMQDVAGCLPPTKTPPMCRAPRRVSFSNSPISPSRSISQRYTDDEDELHPSLQYFNLSTLPPAVDRALKPRQQPSSGPMAGQSSWSYNEPRPDTLQYLDLDLKPSTLTQNKAADGTSHARGKSHSSDSESAYKTVDFLKTEAFNITRQDAEALRSGPC